MYDFRRITLFCLENRLSKQKITKFSKNLGGRSWPLCSPMATPMDAVPRRRVIMGAPNQCRERPMAAGAVISPNNVPSTSFNIEHMLPKDFSFEYGGDKLASYPGRHPTSLRPCAAHVTIN